MSETPDEVLGVESAKVVTPKSAPEQPVSQPRRIPRPVRIRLYRDDDGYRFVGVTRAGHTIKETESHFSYTTAQHAKRAAHAAHPTLSIR